MSRDVIHVRHHVPVIGVPQGGRRERIGMREVTTPVRPARLASGEVRLAHPGRFGPSVIFLGPGLTDSDPPLWEAEGRLWTEACVAAPTAGNMQVRKRVPPSVLVDALGRRPRQAGWSSLRRHLALTPVDGTIRTACGDVATLGEPEVSGLVPSPRHEDLDDLARNAVRRFVEDEIRLVGNAILLAHDGVHLVGSWTRRLPATSEFAHGLATTHPRHSLAMEIPGMRGFAVRIDRLSGWRAMAAVLGTSPDAPIGVPRAATGVSGPTSDTDVRAQANLIAVRLAGLLTGRGPRAEEFPSLARWAALGAVAAVPPDELPDLLDLVERLASQAVQGLRHGPRLQGLVECLTYVRSVALPALAATDGGPGTADRDAMEGLGT